MLTSGAAPTPVRCKYAVLSSRAFARLTSRRALYPYIWARFAQPALLAWTRDEEARRHVQASVANAVRTFVQRLSPFLPIGERVRFIDFWQDAFLRTYQTEFRGESAETIRSHYNASPERYASVTKLALEALVAEGKLSGADCDSESFEIQRNPTHAKLARLRWRLAHPLAKTLAVLRLFKTATTFGDWLPYALWKLERHSGVRPELSERQRKHPFIFAWPVIFRVLTQRTLR